jgi:membrane-bound ClpP family serine protease
MFERVFMIGGGVLLLGGFVAIVIGWLGASHTPLPFEQTPFIISGGLLGLGLIFTGSFFYFAYWLTRMVREMRESREEANKAFRTMNEMAELLATVLKEVDALEPAAADGQVHVATQGGTMFHRPDCAVVSGRRDLRKVSADEPGLEPCKMCDPLGAPKVNA